MVAIFLPNEDAIMRLVGALLEQNDEWAVTRRYMPLEPSIARAMLPAPGRKGSLRLNQARTPDLGPWPPLLRHHQGHDLLGRQLGGWISVSS